ncbi:ribbon-helix-helix protein, CopG family [Nocardia asiatica]|uniref:ribbon-helix-helix protein, CopG family n=1 Tax=Nocardia asiatica TaxID=209252 RepID=UPI0012FB47EE|nr:ribbon-helix-helix protein, CopG family [Nocardia asiatica]
MSSTDSWPDTPEEMEALAARIVYTDEEVELPPTPGPTGVMVSRSVRMSSELDARLKAEATKRGINQSTLMRQLVEEGLRLAEEADRTISLRDAVRLLSGLPEKTLPRTA